MLNVNWNIVKGKVLVALSGGADSVALLRLLHERMPADIEALHCNFQLRGEESDRDERFVNDLCKRLGIPLHTTLFDTRYYSSEHRISIEMAARKLRYDWFEVMRQQLHADAIAVAHHREDQAETLLLNLIRGTGIRGLVGMLPVQGHIIRPLLQVSKDEILHYLENIGQDYVTDSTNLERDALRNRLRLDILPQLQQLNPQATQHIAEAASHVAEALPYYEKGIGQSTELTATTLHEKLRGCGFTPSQEAAILQQSEGQPGAIYESATHRLLRDRGQFILEAKADSQEETPTLHSTIIESDDALAYLKGQSLTPDRAYLDADKVCQPLTLRHPRQGDRFQPYGMKRGTRLISDFLTDQHLNLFEKQKQWLVCSGDDIVWVCNLRPDHRYRVTEKTRRILILHL